MAKMQFKKKKKVMPQQDAVALSVSTDESEVGMAELVDQIGALDLEVLKIMSDPKIKKLKGLRERLVELINQNFDDEEKTTVVGEVFEVDVGARALVRKINDMEKTKELMGPETFMKVAKVGLKEIDDYLNPEERAEVIDSAYTGNRSLKFSKKE